MCIRTSQQQSHRLYQDHTVKLKITIDAKVYEVDVEAVEPQRCRPQRAARLYRAVGARSRAGRINAGGGRARGPRK